MHLELDGSDCSIETVQPSNRARRESEDALVIEPSSKKTLQVVIDISLFVVDASEP